MITVPDRPLKTEADFDAFFRELDRMAKQMDGRTREAIEHVAILTGCARRVGIPTHSATLTTNDLRTGADLERHNAKGVDVEFAVDWRQHRLAWGGRYLDTLYEREGWPETWRGPAPQWWERPHAFFSLTRPTSRHHPAPAAPSTDRHPGVEVLWKDRHTLCCDHDTGGEDPALVPLFTALPIGTYDLLSGLGLMERMWRLLQSQAA